MIDFSVNNTSYTGVWDPLVTRMIDVSQYQGEMDFDKAKIAGIQAAIIRCTIGNYKIDPLFYENWEKAEDAGLIVAPYIVVNPLYTAADHIDYFYDKFLPRESYLPVALDCELQLSVGPEILANVIKGCCNLLDGYAMIYTRATWWNPFVARRDYWKDYPLWVAHYNSAISEPDLPIDWNDWAIWQWSAGGNGQGEKYGASSADIDLNRVQYADFLQEPPTNGGDMSELDDFIEKMRDENIPITARITYQIDGFDDVPDPEPPPPDPDPDPDPDPEPTVYKVSVVEDKTLAHFAVSQNAAGYPVMEIYPSEGSAPADRIKFVRGDEIPVILSSTEWIVGDGATKWYEMADDHGTGEKLYVNKDDVMKLW